MKFFSVAWVCYLLVLPCLPCTHDREAPLRAVEVISTGANLVGTETPAAESRDHDEDQACSPFCTCSYCGAHLSIPQTPGFAAEPNGWQLLPVGHFSYASPSWVTPLATIWQPPQLG
jgi:hypothetical protein